MESAGKILWSQFTTVTLLATMLAFVLGLTYQHALFQRLGVDPGDFFSPADYIGKIWVSVAYSIPFSLLFLIMLGPTAQGLSESKLQKIAHAVWQHKGPISKHDAVVLLRIARTVSAVVITLVLAAGCYILIARPAPVASEFGLKAGSAGAVAILLIGAIAIALEVSAKVSSVGIRRFAIAACALLLPVLLFYGAGDCDGISLRFQNAPNVVIELSSGNDIRGVGLENLSSGVILKVLPSGNITLLPNSSIKSIRLCAASGVGSCGLLKFTPTARAGATD